MDDWGQTTEKDDGGIKYEHDEITCKNKPKTFLPFKDENRNYIISILFFLLSILLSFRLHNISNLHYVIFPLIERSC